MEMKAYLGWVDFYMELADKLLPYKNDRKTLIEKNKGYLYRHQYAPAEVGGRQ